VRTEAAMDLCRKLNAVSRDVMLVFYGKDVPEEEAEHLVADLQKEYKNLEIILNCGLQPVYDYIFVLC
jgi:dihydroxyacetone kinase-like predicted kinase